MDVVVVRVVIIIVLLARFVKKFFPNLIFFLVRVGRFFIYCVTKILQLPLGSPVDVTPLLLLLLLLLMVMMWLMVVLRLLPVLLIILLR